MGGAIPKRLYSHPETPYAAHSRIGKIVTFDAYSGSFGFYPTVSTQRSSGGLRPRNERGDRFSVL